MEAGYVLRVKFPKLAAMVTPLIDGVPRSVVYMNVNFRLVITLLQVLLDVLKLGDSEVHAVCSPLLGSVHWELAKVMLTLEPCLNILIKIKSEYV